MKKVLGFLIVLLGSSLAHAEQTKQLYNPFTGRPDYYTALSTISVTGDANITVSTNSNGVALSLNTSRIILSTDTLQTGTTIYVSSASINGTLTVYSSATILQSLTAKTLSISTITSVSSFSATAVDITNTGLHIGGNQAFPIVTIATNSVTGNKTSTTNAYLEIMSTTGTVKFATSRIRVRAGATIRVTDAATGNCIADLKLQCGGTTVQEAFDAIDDNVPTNFITVTVPLEGEYFPGAAGSLNCTALMKNQGANGTVSFNPNTGGVAQSWIKFEEIAQ